MIFIFTVTCQEILNKNIPKEEKDMILGLDVDGVVFNSAKHKVDLVKQFYGIDIPLELARGKHFIKMVFETKTNYLNFGDVAYEIPYGLEIEPIPEAFFYIRLLESEGVKLPMISSRDEEKIQVAFQLFQKYDYSPDLVGVGYERSKLDAILFKECSGYVDDDLHKLFPLVGFVEHLFLFSHEYNWDEETGPDIQRVADWKELYLAVRKIREGTRW